jgi:hypothetical protein
MILEIQTNSGFLSFYFSLLHDNIFDYNVLWGGYFSIFSIVIITTAIEMCTSHKKKIFSSIAYFFRLLLAGALIGLGLSPAFIGFQLVMDALSGMVMSGIVIGIPVIALMIIYFIFNSIK